MVFFPNADPIRLRAPSVPDPYGNVEENWDEASETQFYRWHIQPFSGTETDNSDRNQIVTRYRCFAPPGTDILESDRIKWNDIVYEVEAEPELWPDPFGVAHHVELFIKRVRG